MQEKAFYQSHLHLAYSEVQRLISQYPPPLDQLGLNYLARFNILDEHYSRNEICYALPYWMRELTELPDQPCLDLTTASIFAMLYFYIMDDAMDLPERIEREKHALGHLLHNSFLHIYRGLFPKDSPFWHYYDQYNSVWAASVVNEYQEDYFQQHTVSIAGKASPMKWSSTAALLLSNQEQLIPLTSQTIDYVLATLQMSDDMADWEIDLQTGSYNSLLSLIKSRLSPEQELTPELVKNYIYIHHILQDYLQLALSNYENSTAANLPISHLNSFHSLMIEDLSVITKTIEEERSYLHNGGLYHWIVKNI